ncbi:sodium:proton antiporter [Sulfolobus sp. A20]|nr:sodium:proton antiporter [Sulfolobus sp. A20]TRM75830.1 CBS domain-containing protein [Sulfolobus sp. E5]TRM77452.1 CBS domain-containing protein [Sulfolobus sp. A20-N-F8]TRM84106.1 CBS domain-containing protein [Sulfolobus sp. A20-N-F6]TRM85304.1 CBS domain-containing protein [Sulfolobus sp. F3]TRM86608.1 CBS domain-containing protein [Sulfolobus sp. C3]TRM89234.1 CBS domain-containing protein [Sulfolobus sp. E3]TRM92777.1 CBS domain-containing protein [Sulfolobus sp. A20-N-G8]TRM96851.
MLILAKVAEEAFSRLGLIPFVGSIIVGIILGRGVIGLIPVNSIISFISSLGIILLLFLAGAEEISSEFRFNYFTFYSVIIQLLLPFIIIFLTLEEIIQTTNSLVLLVPLMMTSVGPLTRLLIDLGISRQQLGASLFYQGTLVEIISVIIFSIFLEARSTISISVLYVTLEIIGIFALIIALGPIIAKLLEKIEGYIKVREIEFASVIALILIIGFLAEYLKFNSAISALFLGYLLRDYFKDRPELLEKLHGFTYGFFEPLFFVSIGLYFVKISPQIILYSIILFISIVGSKFLAGYLSARLVNVDPTINGLGTSTKGGVDVSLLVSALSLNAITALEYSYSTLAISLSALVIPLLFKLKTGFKVSKEETKIKLNTRISSILSLDQPKFVTCDNNLREVINKLNERGLRAAIVVNREMRPIGIITVKTLLEINPEDYDRLRVCDVYLDEAVLMGEDSKVLDVLRKFRETETPVIGIIDKDNKLKGTIYERELLRFIVTK